MKKLLILSIFLISGMNVFAQNKQDTTKITVREVYNDAKQVLSELGNALKVGSEHVYEVLVKQQLVSSITNVILYLLIIPTILLSIYFTKKTDFDDEKTIPIFVIAVLLGACSIILIIKFVVSLDGTITGFVNPEYGAINQIMELIKK